MNDVIVVQNISRFFNFRCKLAYCLIFFGIHVATRKYVLRVLSGHFAKYCQEFYLALLNQKYKELKEDNVFEYIGLQATLDQMCYLSYFLITMT